jgi:hypothetical protein
MRHSLFDTGNLVADFRHRENTVAAMERIVAETPVAAQRLFVLATDNDVIHQDMIVPDAPHGPAVIRDVRSCLPARPDHSAFGRDENLNNDDRQRSEAESSRRESENTNSLS